MATATTGRKPPPTRRRARANGIGGLTLDQVLVGALHSNERIKVLQEVSAAGRGGMSAKDYHVKTSLPLSHVAYHFRVLREGGFLRVTRTRPRRGAMEKFVVITARGVRALKVAAAIAAVRSA